MRACVDWAYQRAFYLTWLVLKHSAIAMGEWEQINHVFIYTKYFTNSKHPTK